MSRRRSAVEALEHRYRRLLAWYPAAYRAERAEEMLGVAMARSAPGRRWPDLAETADLIRSGIRTRLGGMRSGVREPAWRDAAAVLGVLGPILLSGASAEAVGNAGWGLVSIGLPTITEMSRASIAMAVGWALVALAAILGWRRIAAAGAVLGVIGQATVRGLHYSTDASGVVMSWWQLVLAMVVALSALVAIRSEKRPLSWPALVAIVVAVALVAAWPAVAAATITVTASAGGGEIIASPVFGVLGLVTDGLLALTAIVLLVVAGRLAPPVRRRVAVLLLPVAGTMTLIAWTFGGFLASSPRFSQPVLLTAPQWAALTLVPVAGFALGLIWLARYERMLRHLAARGSAG